ncbi:hypothetical protein L7F22_032356 [Adiantum nelumboides]|nr:hypothetical protein [Adiantum nelumboides]
MPKQMGVFIRNLVVAWTTCPVKNDALEKLTTAVNKVYEDMNVKRRIMPSHVLKEIKKSVGTNDVKSKLYLQIVGIVMEETFLLPEDEFITLLLECFMKQKDYIKATQIGMECIVSEFACGMVQIGGEMCSPWVKRIAYDIAYGMWSLCSNIFINIFV